MKLRKHKGRRWFIQAIAHTTIWVNLVQIRMRMAQRLFKQRRAI